MFNLFKKKTSQQTAGEILRDKLFGDVPIHEWPPQGGDAPETETEEPWASFVAAREQLSSGNSQQAIEHWRRVLTMPDLESRQYLQAWHFLRENGIVPPDEVAKHVYGVIVEVALPGGLDILAAYADGHARYFNHGGGGVVWESPDASLDEQINALLQAGQATADQIGPWLEPRPEAPSKGNLRLSMLTPSGLHFGQGPTNVLSNDALAKPVFDAATQLMLALIEKQSQASNPS